MPDESKQYDAEETREEAAARRIDAASDQFAQRCDLFLKTLRSNVRDLTPYKRQLVAAWVKRHNDRLLRTVEESDGIPPLGIDGLPDYDRD